MNYTYIIQTVQVDESQDDSRKQKATVGQRGTELNLLSRRHLHPWLPWGTWVAWACPSIRVSHLVWSTMEVEAGSSRRWSVLGWHFRACWPASWAAVAEAVYGISMLRIRKFGVDSLSAWLVVDSIRSGVVVIVVADLTVVVAHWWETNAFPGTRSVCQSHCISY